MEQKQKRLFSISKEKLVLIAGLVCCRLQCDEIRVNELSADE